MVNIKIIGKTVASSFVLIPVMTEYEELQADTAATVPKKVNNRKESRYCCLELSLLVSSSNNFR
jgi:hypothetical protein